MYFVTKLVRWLLPAVALLGYPLWMHWYLLRTSSPPLAWAFFLQFLLSQLFLAGLFANTLRRNKLPLISQLAQFFHGTPLSLKMQSYTRWVTWAWVIYFLTMVTLSFVLYFLVDVAVWSFFSNVLYLPILITMFLLEYLARHLYLPEVKHASIAKSVQLYWQQRSKAVEKQIPPVR